MTCWDWDRFATRSPICCIPVLPTFTPSSATWYSCHGYSNASNPTGSRPETSSGGCGKGVIGYQAGRALKRMPSSIYWQALRDWGIRRLPLNLGEYAQGAGAIGRYRAGRDDDGNVTEAAHSMWAPLPPPPEDFLQADIGFELSPEEAHVLVDNIRHRHPQTLLASLCTQPGIVAGLTYPWDVPETNLPGRVTEALRHARCFSELMAGPQYTYNVLVARDARRELQWDTDEVERSQLARLQRWVELVERRREELRSWTDALPALWTLLDKRRIRHNTRRFIDTTAKMAIDNPEGFNENRAIHEHIRLREIQLKGKRARLGNRAALENWNGSPVGGPHGYRWSIAKGHLGDIATALETDA